MKIQKSSFYSNDRQPLGKVLPLNSPYFLKISVSNACNFRCIYCFRSANENPTNRKEYTKPFMDFDMFVKIVQQMKEFPVPIKRVLLNDDGEPLCHKELTDMIKYLRKEFPNIRISIQTNGSLLTHDLSDKLAESGMDDILLALQGITAAKYKEICGVDIDFNEFVNNIKYLHSVSKKYHDMKIYAKIADIAIDEQEIDEYHRIFDPITDGAVIEKINPIFNAVDYSKIGVDVNDNTNRVGADYGKQKVCMRPFYTLIVLPSGSVYPCEIDPLILGNINDKSLVEIWNDNIRLDFLKNMLRKEPIPYCDACEIKNRTAKVPEDIVDPYAEEILERLTTKG